MDIDDLLEKNLRQAFGLSFSRWINKEQLIAALTMRIDELISGNPDQLFSMLYRLDISEKKIKTALTAEADFSKRIANLIYERQLEKIKSRAKDESPKPDDDLAW